jgi:hypothetical protein
MCLRSIPPKHVENDGVIDSTQRKKSGFAQVGRNALQSILNQGKILRGLTVACPHLFEWQNPKHTWKKRSQGKSIDLNFDFFV